MSVDLFAVTTEARKIELWPWQHEAVDGLRRKIETGDKSLILVSPTGSGKTITAAYLIRQCWEKGLRAAFVADRISLIDQTSATFDTYGIPHGVIQADHWRWRPWEKIQVASAQTLARRKWPDDLALIVVDEAHTIHTSTAKRIAQRDCVVIGLTATPFTKGLGQHYHSLVTVRTLNQLTADGYLAPFKVWSPSEPDMTGAKVVAGEWTEKEVESRAMPIVGDIVTEYLAHAAGKKFIAFGASVAHCEEIHRQMTAAGVKCGLYTYQTGDTERSEMVKEFSKRDSYLDGLISVAALAKGFDNPGVEVVIMARPLRSSLTEHVQILGRGLRRDPNNPEKVCIVLDHAGNMRRFWSRMHDFFEHGASGLDMGHRAEKKKPEAREVEPLKCPKCSHLHDPRPVCPMCGHEYPRRSGIEHVAGKLSPLTGLPDGSGEDRQSVYSQLLAIGRARGYKPGWAGRQFKHRFGTYPHGLDEVEMEPTPAVERWVRSRLIAFAKMRAKAERSRAAA